MNMVDVVRSYGRLQMLDIYRYPTLNRNPASSGFALVHAWQMIAQACAGIGDTSWPAFGNSRSGFMLRVAACGPL